MAKDSPSPEQATISRNSKITLGAACAMVLAAASSVWWISNVVTSLKEANDESVRLVRKEMTAAVDQMAANNQELSKALAETARRVSDIESYNENSYRKRFTRDHVEIWWLRSEREKPGGTGLIDPKLIFDGSEDNR